MTCFIMMPIADFEPYAKGHFGRVYEYLIKPSCLSAGFEPIRADEILNTNYIAIDIIRKLISCEMAICDLSGRNPNVLYELGIRQAFNLPVTLIKDSLTPRIFDISGFRDIEYDESLRIDKVEKDIKSLAETIKNTFESKGKEINSLVSLLGIQPATVSDNVYISKDTEVILNYINSLSEKVNDLDDKINYSTSIEVVKPEVREVLAFDPNGLKICVNDSVEHAKFGIGRVLALSGTEANPVGAIQFSDKVRHIVLNYAKVYKK